MPKPKINTKLTKEEYFKEAFSRNIPLLTEEQQFKLQNSKVAIAGMGGVGGAHAITAARTGFGKFHLADLDTFEEANINRQAGAMDSTFGKPKVTTIATMVKDVNPYAEVKEFKKGISKKNINEFLEGVDVVFDGLDFFEFDARRTLYMTAYNKGIHVVTAGPIGFGCPWLVFAPGKMSFDQYFDVKDSMKFEDKIITFGIGLAPGSLQMSYMRPGKINLTNKAGPSSIVGVNLCAAMACFEAMNVILKIRPIRAVPAYQQFDIRKNRLKKGYLIGGNGNPLQKLKRFIAKKLFFRPSEESNKTE